MTTLYSIAGFFNQNTPFGGFFLHGDELKALGKNCFNLEGMLSDVYGASSIRGNMIPTISINFIKTYILGNVIDYQFIFNEKMGLWEGHYKFSEGKIIQEGTAECKINPAFESLELEMTRKQGVEDWVKRAISLAIENRYIKEVQVP